MASIESNDADTDRPLVVLSTRHDRIPDSKLFFGIAEQAKSFGWDILDLRFTYGVLPAGRKIAGALIDALPPDGIACELRETGVPAVRIGNRSHPMDDRLPAVLPNLVTGAQMAVDHFLAIGLRNLVYVGREPWASGRSFYEAFRDRCLASGCDCQLARVPSGPESRAGRYRMRVSAMMDWLPSVSKPIGIMTSIDRDAGFICTVCHDLGVKVPGEAAVLGNGNRELDCEMAPVPLSSIDWAKREQGLQAAALLKRLMDGEEQPEGPLLVEPAGVVVRRSTAMK